MSRRNFSQRHSIQNIIYGSTMNNPTGLVQEVENHFHGGRNFFQYGPDSSGHRRASLRDEWDEQGRYNDEGPYYNDHHYPHGYYSNRPHDQPHHRVLFDEHGNQFDAYGNPVDQPRLNRGGRDRGGDHRAIDDGYRHDHHRHNRYPRAGNNRPAVAPMAPLHVLPEYLSQQHHPPLLPMAPMRRVNRAMAPLNLVTAYLNHAQRLEYYEVDLDPHPQPARLIATLDGDVPETVNRLLQHWHAALYSQQGMLLRYFRVKEDADYSTLAGPLIQRARKELVAGAALICMQYGRGVGKIAGHGKMRCANWGAETQIYERMTVMASIIATRFPFPDDRDITTPITFHEIMNFNIYGAMKDVLSRLQSHGIVSEDATSVQDGTDLMSDVYLPTFLFFDALMDDRHFRGHCKLRNLWVGTTGHHSETRQIHDNPRLVGNPRLALHRF